MRKKLQANKLVKKYGEKTVVNQVSLSIETGEIVGLLGPNGAGKSTTFYMIAGIITPDSGTVIVADKDVTDYPMYKRAREGIGYLPQEPSIFRGLSTKDNLRVVIELITSDKDEQEAKINKLLDEFGLQKFADTRGDLLSGGERRRVEIARALAAEPSFILLDEPFAGIDPITISELQQIIVNLKDKGIGIIITDHNIKETLRITDNAFILSNGTILKNGTPKEISEDKTIREVYLGKDFKLN
jgi:lipopolysaccharide export system ATP-binding protein